ncbi:MAG: tyrosine--tRNA ligase [Alphaproteobacteria bacterium]|nr:tyrosine--tRNA ligase [Alphaproteobacteria bacterium]
MTARGSDFLSLLEARRALHQCTDAAALRALFDEGKPVVGYIGFDCTAPSLHVGSLLQIMTLRRLQQCGGKPIVLLGGGTTKVGDPSGRDESRQILSDAQIAENARGIRKIFERFLTFGDGPSDAILVDNDEWLSELRYVPFLREIGRHFSVNTMIKMDSVRLRLEREQSLSFLEFNYMLLQAYDFVELARRYGCRLQMGGSDQWGNIVSGVELGRRTDGLSLFGVTSPLITTSSGAKMGKTAAGAVWLNPDMLSAYDYWQFWRNTEDADVGRFLRIFTDLPEAEILRLESLQGAELNDAKKRLATEATALAHGAEAAHAAADTARRTFEAGETADDLPGLFISRAELEKGVQVAIASAHSSFLPSASEARRLIANRGLRVNDRVVEDPKELISLADLAPGGFIKLSIGKKKHALLRPKNDD